LRSQTAAHGALLIFDEVMTGFRVGDRKCAQGYFGIDPDLTCFGKVIGGGLPVGAYGGKREIMSQIAPVGAIYQAGTLSGNPLAMAAGVATLKALENDKLYADMDRRADMLVKGLQAAADDAGIPFSAGHFGSMAGFFFTGQPVRNFDDAKTCDLDLFAKFYRGMLANGIYLAPSQFEACFISAAHTDEDIEITLDAARQVMAEI
jgi:glutamate-1-semialdehyde 2,1-aminomutase